MGQRDDLETADCVFLQEHLHTNHKNAGKIIVRSNLAQNSGFWSVLDRHFESK